MLPETYPVLRNKEQWKKRLAILLKRRVPSFSLGADPGVKAKDLAEHLAKYPSYLARELERNNRRK